MQVIPAEEPEYTGPERRKIIPLTPEAHAKICTIETLTDCVNSIYGRLGDGNTRMQGIEERLAAVNTVAQDSKLRTERIEKSQYEIASRLEAMERSDAARTELIGMRMDRQDASMQQNTAVTQEVRDILNAFKGFGKFLGWVGIGLKWGLGIGASVLAFWVALRDFRMH